MVQGDINMNAACNNHVSPCIDPSLIMRNPTEHLDAATYDTDVNGADLYDYQGAPVYDETEQPVANHGLNESEPSTGAKIIRAKLYFLIAAHKAVQTGKGFIAVARITKDHQNPFVDAQGVAYHYIPDTKHQQFNTSTPLSKTELASAVCDDRAFTVLKTTGTSCAPAGTYLVYRLKRLEPGTRNVRFEASWDWGDGTIGQAAYDFVYLTAQHDIGMKSYTSLQKKLLGEIWPEWESYLDW
ncbi:hypothetical protein F4802DRAFT_593693 [Xylaria palmicola]|nr:hypothetical protein F4802DRAFT_593693 [Xylaria palmicola]